MSNWLEQFDVFVYNVNFSFGNSKNNKENQASNKHGTACGGLMSLFIKFAYYGLAFYYFFQMINFGND